MPFTKEVREWKQVTRVGATCTVCGVVLKPFSVNLSGYADAFEGAMYVTIGGSGYGELFDSRPEEVEILCETCAKKFIADNPFIAKMVEKMRD
jgi:hypothetical protein